MDFKKKIVELITKETSEPFEKIDSLLTIPPKGLGDYAFPCFVLSKKLSMSPTIIAQNLSKTINANFLEKIEAQGPYLNFYLSKKDFSTSVLENIFANNTLPKTSEKIMIEYSSPNTNKPLHLGHLRNNFLGQSISNVFEYVGHEVIRTNLYNDRGIHICKSMLAYKLFANNRNPVSEGIKTDHFVGEMYVLFEKKNKENPELNLEEKAREMLNQWENNDKEVMALWKKMNDWVIKGIEETYVLIGTKFDKYYYEHEIFFNAQKNDLIEEGLEKKVFVREDNGAITALLEPNLPNKVIVRGDGTSLYTTNDLLLTQIKFDEYNLTKSIWVVANEQDLYFKQLFKMFENLGRPWANQCHQLSYGYINLTTGKMKSREGTIVDADTLINDLKKIALIELNKRYKNLSEKEKDYRALIIALSAIKFFLLKNDSKKDMLFNPKQSISFEGETGPYLLYTYARAKSILNKALSEQISFDEKNFELLVEEKEKELIIALSRFENSVAKSVKQFSLHSICHNLLLIAEKFNSYYHDTPILKSGSRELINARLSLVKATTKVLSKGLRLLDINFLEEM